jgi:hypothetical protein
MRRSCRSREPATWTDRCDRISPPSEHEAVDPDTQDQVEHLTRLLDTERRRGFVHDYQALRPFRHPRDRDALTLSARKVLDRPSDRPHADLEFGEVARGLAPHRAVVEYP